MATSTHRPVTSKPRGICRYYTDPRGCFAGDNCKFLHAEPSQVEPEHPPLLTPYDQAKRCRYFANGFCRRGDKCWFQHVVDPKEKGNAVAEAEEEDEFCAICFEKPVTFGLLGGCSHVFCIACIKQWRDPVGKGGDMVESGNTKKCPMCRTPSKFITPSSQFFKQGDAEKIKAIQAYKESMARVPCRYFQQSRQKNKYKPLCPFGKDCFYQHLNEDGTPYIFKDGVDVCMRQHRSRRIFDGGLRFNSFFPIGFDGIPFPTFTSGFDIFGDIDVVVNAGEPANLSPWQQRTRERNTGRARLDLAAARERTETATRRLQEVSQSLEALNNAVFDGAGPDSLNMAVESLRRGMTRLDAVRATMGQPRRRRRPDIAVPGTWGANGVFEDDDGNEWVPDDDETDGDAVPDTEAMNQLEILADQMIASLDFLRTTTTTADEEADRSGTPPPPLEPIIPGPLPTSGNSTPPPPLMTTQAFMRQFNDGESIDGVDNSQDDMPELQSVSNSSNSEDNSEDEDSDEADSDGDDDSMDIDTRAAREVLRAFELYDEMEEEMQAGRAMDMETLGRAWPVFQFLNARSGRSRNMNANAPGTNTTVHADAPAPWSTNEVETVTNDREEAANSDDDMPGLEPVTDPEDEGEEQEDDMPSLEPVASLETDAPLSTRSSPGIPSEPPFVTDGRGRVVWSSPASPTPSTELGAPPLPKTNHRVLTSRGEFTTDGRGRVISVSNSGSSEDADSSAMEPESDPSNTESSNRSFIGRMFDAFF